MSNITEKIKKAVQEGTQQIIKPIYEELDNRSILGKELQYGEFSLYCSKETQIENNTVIALEKKYGNIEFDNDTKHIKLKAYSKYKITCITTGTSTGNPVQLQLFDKNDNIILGLNCMYQNDSQSGIIYEVLSEPAEIYLKSVRTISTWGIRVIVEEISRQIIIDPTEKAKNIEFKKGYFITKYNTDTNIAYNENIKFDNMLNGNMKIDNNGGIILESNKTYRINYGIQANTIPSGNLTFCLYDINKGSNIDNSFIYPFSSVSTYDYSSSTSREIMITPTEDISLVVRQIQTNKSFNIVTSGCFMFIQELPHPYYFNYYKDSISSKVLFEGDATSTGEYALLDDINNYEWLDILCSLSLTSNVSVHNNKQVIRIHVSDIKYVNAELTYNVSVGTATRRILFGFKDKNTLRIDSMNLTENTIIARIEKIIGIGFNYENPYKDLISSGSNIEINEFDYTDDEITENLTGIWGEE